MHNVEFIRCITRLCSQGITMPIAFFPPLFYMKGLLNILFWKIQVFPISLWIPCSWVTSLTGKLFRKHVVFCLLWHSDSLLPQRSAALDPPTEQRAPVWWQISEVAAYFEEMVPNASHYLCMFSGNLRLQKARYVLFNVCRYVNVTSVHNVFHILFIQREDMTTHRAWFKCGITFHLDFRLSEPEDASSVPEKPTCHLKTRTINKSQSSEGVPFIQTAFSRCLYRSDWSRGLSIILCAAYLKWHRSQTDALWAFAEHNESLERKLNSSKLVRSQVFRF